MRVIVLYYVLTFSFFRVLITSFVRWVALLGTAVNVTCRYSGSVFLPPNVGWWIFRLLFPIYYVDYLIHTMCSNLIQPLKPRRAFGPTLKSPLVLHAATCRYWHPCLDASSLPTASHSVGPSLQIPQIPT